MGFKQWCIKLNIPPTRGGGSIKMVGEEGEGEREWKKGKGKKKGRKKGREKGMKKEGKREKGKREG